MDFVYDHTLTSDAPESNGKGKEPARGEQKEESLNEEFRQAYQALSNSPWGAKLGAFAGSVWKQADTALVTAQKEYGSVAEQASKGFSNVVTRARGLSLSNALGTPPAPPSNPSDPSSSSVEKPTTGDGEETLFSKLKKTAAQRIAELEEAERRADEYLAQFGSQIGSFLRDAVTITPPDENASGDASNEVLFETKAGSTAGKQIYTSRLDAQLHLLHTNVELFKTDPKPESFGEFESGFKAEDAGVTERIGKDLEAFPELRKTMEALVPEKVSYVKFWTRYYFFREELDRDEKKRKELLKGAVMEEEEEVGWDEDDESEEESSEEDSEDEEDEEDEDEDEGEGEGEGDKEINKGTTTSVEETKKLLRASGINPADLSAEQFQKICGLPRPQQERTIQRYAESMGQAVREKASVETLTPEAPRQSTDRTSQPDSESSYDLVSGAPSKATSQGPDSPPAKAAKKVEEESDEEDWE